MKSIYPLLLLAALSPIAAQIEEAVPVEPAIPESTTVQDTLETSPDSLTILPDTTIVSQQGREKEPKKKNPRTAMLLSAFIPAGGQLYNQSLWKAPFIAGGEITLGYFTVKEHLAMQEARQDTSLTQDEREDLVNSHMDRRNTFGFFTLAVIAFSMADAYVDAHMFGFKKAQTLTLTLPEQGIGLAVRYNF